MTLFKRKPKPLGSVLVMNFGTIAMEEIPESKKQSIEAIHSAINYYTDRMVTHMRENTGRYGTLRICEMSANYNMDDDTVDVMAKGKGFMSWRGPLEEFLGRNINLIGC